jgi:hypothetical protein
VRYLNDLSGRRRFKWCWVLGASIEEGQSSQGRRRKKGESTNMQTRILSSFDVYSICLEPKLSSTIISLDRS